MKPACSKHTAAVLTLPGITAPVDACGLDRAQAGPDAFGKGGPVNGRVEPCDHDAVERIARGRYTEACLAIGGANLPTILAAQQRVSDEVAAAQASGEPHRGYVGRLKLVRGRRRRLQAEARARAQAGREPAATFRV